MQAFLDSLSRGFEAIPDIMTRRKWIVWGLFVALMIAWAPGANKFQLDLSDEAFFDDADPINVAYKKFRAKFGGDESIYIVYEAKDGDLFSQQSLQAVRNIQEELLNYRLHLKPGEESPLDHMTDVRTLVNVSYLEASDDALVSRQFIGDDIPSSTDALNRLRNEALSHPDYPLLYISKDAKYGGIMIRTDFRATLKHADEEITTESNNNSDEFADEFADEFSDDFEAMDVTNAEEFVETSKDQPLPEFEFVDANDYAEFMREVNKIILKPEYQNAITIYPVGTPVIHAFVVDTLFKQSGWVMLGSLMLVVVSCWILFRSLAAVLWPVAIIGISSILMVATLGWFGISMNMMINISILLILVVGVADSVHILSGYNYFRRQGYDHAKAMSNAYKHAGMAVLLTSITTAIGMLALLLVPIDAINNFGISAAIGVLLAFLVSVFMLPVMMDLWSPVSKKAGKKFSEKTEHHFIQRMLQKVEHLSHVNPKLNITIFSLIGIIFLFGITKIEVDSNPMSLFEPESQIVKDFNVVDKFMGGTQNIEVMIDMKTEGALKDPEVLQAMEKLQESVNAIYPDVIQRTFSLVNIVKDANKSLNGGSEEFYTIPDDRNLLEQTLFLFNNANPSDRRRVVSDDYRFGHITINTKNVGSKYYVEILDTIKPEIEKAFAPIQLKYPHMDISTTGAMTLFANLLDTLSWSQIKGFGIAMALISIILLLVFGSIKLGIISLYPNLLPLVVMFGLMGYLGIPLDVDTLIVAPLMIGIVVDDTIHFLNHYRAAVLKHGDPLQGIKVAFREVGQAITFTSIILALAFMAMIALDHQGMKNFGILSSITIAVALLAELFLLPALLLQSNANLKKQRESLNLETNPA